MPAEVAQSQVLQGLSRASDLQLHHGQLNALLGVGGGDPYARVEALYKLTPSSALFGYAQDDSRLGLSAGLGYRLNF